MITALWEGIGGWHWSLDTDDAVYSGLRATEAEARAEMDGAMRDLRTQDAAQVDALRSRAEAAEQRAEAWRWFAQEVASDVHPIGADPLGDITTDLLPVLLDITRRAAQQQGADCARAEAAEQRAEAAERELAQARAEGEAAGAARERAAVVAWLRETVWAADEADYIERGEHVGAAGGAA